MIFTSQSRGYVIAKELSQISATKCHPNFWNHFTHFEYNVTRRNRRLCGDCFTIIMCRILTVLAARIVPVAEKLVDKKNPLSISISYAKVEHIAPRAISGFCQRKVSIKMRLGFLAGYLYVFLNPDIVQILD